jgi:AmiR/NasT family two-component response regulator
VTSNREIGIAVGILMPGSHTTREEAFDRLRAPTST